jgi:HEPN domain-containing protein
VRSYLANFNDKSGADAADLAAAQSGYDNGKNQRFLNSTLSENGSINRGKDNKSDDFIDFIIALNPDYAALFESTMGKELSGIAKNSCFAIAQATYALSCEMALKSLIAYKSGTQRHPHGHVIPNLIDELKNVDSSLHDRVQEKLKDALSAEELNFFLRDVDHSATSKYLHPSVVFNVPALKKSCDTINQIVKDELNIAYGK